MQIIHTDQAPKAIGPYSQAIRVGDFLYISGQIPVDPSTGEVATTIEVNTHQCMRNLQAILNESGADLNQIVKTAIFLADMEDFAKVNEVYGSYFTDTFPARSCVEVSRLPKDVRIEIEAVAYLGN